MPRPRKTPVADAADALAPWEDDKPQAPAVDIKVNAPAPRPGAGLAETLRAALIAAGRAAHENNGDAVVPDPEGGAWRICSSREDYDATVAVERRARGRVDRIHIRTDRYSVETLFGAVTRLMEN